VERHDTGSLHQNAARGRLKGRQNFRSEAGEYDLLDRWFAGQEIRDSLSRDPRCVRDRITVDATTYRWKGDRLHLVRDGELQAVSVAVRKLLRFAVLAVTIPRTDGVDPVAGGKAVALGDPSLTGWATAEGAALLQQVRPGGAVDGAVDATPPSSDSLAALTMASSFKVVMSAC
jgi:hypothetical protein